jgi:hypothetical protein
MYKYASELYNILAVLVIILLSNRLDRIYPLNMYCQNIFYLV